MIPLTESSAFAARMCSSISSLGTLRRSKMKPLRYVSQTQYHCFPVDAKATLLIDSTRTRKCV